MSTPVTLEHSTSSYSPWLVQVLRPAESFYLTTTSFVSRPNYRVIVSGRNTAPLNKRGKPYQVYCLDCTSREASQEANRFCLYQNKWHSLLVSQKGTSAVGPEVPEVHKYDINTPISTLNESITRRGTTTSLEGTISNRDPNLTIHVRDNGPLRNFGPTTAIASHPR